MVLENDKRNNKVVLSLGGNMGEVAKTFKEAIKLISNRIGNPIKFSSIYTTKAWGVESQPDFLNQVILLDSEFKPEFVLKECLLIEQELGRDRSANKKWNQRKIDIDVLFYEDLIISSENLVIPHPYIQNRNFVLFPLVEIIPDFIHPVLQKSMISLKNDCKDKLQVIKTLD